MGPSLTKEQVGVWHRRIERAYRSTKELRSRFALIEQYYQGNYLTKNKGRNKVTANRMLATLRQMASSLYFQSPTIYAKPLSQQGELAAPVVEQILAIELQAIDAETQYRRWVLHGLKYGSGILKHGYNARYSLQDPVAEPNRRGQTGLDTTTANDELVWDSQFTEHNPNVQIGHTWIECIPPWRYLCDPDAATQDDAQWEAHVYDRPWMDVRQDPRMNKAVRERIKPSGRSRWYNEDELNPRNWTMDAEAIDTSMVSLCEIYDRVNRRIITLADNEDEPLMVVPYPYFDRFGPYEKLIFIEDDNSPWGIPYADTFSDQIVALNDLRTSMYDHLQRWGGTRAAYDKSAVADENEMQKWIEAVNGVVGLSTSGQPLDNIVQIFPQIAISGDAWRLADTFDDDLKLVSGVSEISLGGASNGTATEASLIQQQAGLRVGDMRHIVERGIARSATRIMSLVAQFWSGQQVVALLGPDGQAFDYIKVDKDLLQSQYLIYVESGSTERVDKAIKSRQAIDALRELVPVVPMLNAQGYDINWPEMVRTYLKNTDLCRNPDRYIYQIQQPGVEQTPGQMTQGQMPQGMPGNVVPFQGQDPQQIQAQTAAPAAVNQMGQMPSETDPAAIGRMFSEAHFLRGPGV